MEEEWSHVRMAAHLLPSTGANGLLREIKKFGTSHRYREKSAKLTRETAKRATELRFPATNSPYCLEHLRDMTERDI